MELGNGSGNLGNNNTAKIYEMLTAIRERLSSLETRVSIVVEEQDDLAKSLNDTKSKIDDFLREFNQYKGKLGGVIFGVAIMATFVLSVVKFITSYWSSIVSFFRGNGV